MIAVREYLNEGGKAIVAGRNIHEWPTGSRNLSATGPYEWAPDKLPGFFYPPDNGGDDDMPGTAFQRYRGTSNDTWQNYLGAVGKEGGYGTTTFAPGTPVEIKSGSIFSGMDPATIAIDMKEVRLLADGELVATSRTFPFQFRYTPPAAAVGDTVTLVAEAEDKAGNVATATRTVSVVAAPKSDDTPRPEG